MLKINIITVGSLKEKYLRDAIQEYQKRISRFAKLTIMELEEAYLPQNPAPADIERALEKEADAILRRLSDGMKIALCVEGEQLSSEQFADKVRQGEMSGSIDFIIGSSHGLSKRVKSACQTRLSFSKMTFPHQLMRLILCEQIYRAFKINRNENYHK